jgi:class 3 adenylate cyclase
MKRLSRSLKVHLHLALTTVFVLLLTASSIASLAYTYVKTSDAALRSARQMMRQTNTAIYRDVLRYLGTAKRTTRAMVGALKDVRSVHDDHEKILPIIAGQLKAQREVFGISVSDTSGSVLMVGKIFDDPRYSVDRTKPLPPQVKYRIHRADLAAVPKVDTFQYLDAEMRLVDQESVPAEAIKFDARTRAAYRAATTKKANVWTDVTIYSNGQYGTANAEPVLGPDGAVRVVVASSIALSLREGITARLNVAQNGIAFILDEDGRLIAHPDRTKLTRCDPGAKCRLNQASEIGNDALALAVDSYKKKADLQDPANTPRRLSHRDYSARLARLEPEVRAAFDRLYSVDEQKRTIRLRDPLPDGARAALPEVLASISYTYNVRLTSGGRDYLAAFHPFPGHYGKPWTVGTLVPVDDFIGRLKSTIMQVVLISLAILLVSIVLIVLVSRRILRPLALISADMHRIQNLDIDESVRHSSFFYEINMIGSSLVAMKHGLKAFSKFVPVTLVKQLIASGTGAELGGEKRRLTIMFTDIEGFTTIAESMPTEALLQHVSEYLEKLTKIILGESGTVDKYIGDCIMGFWGAPLPVADHEHRACRAALLCARELAGLNARWEREGKPALRTRFGINSGEVTVGNMGSSERMNYTVLGDAVNLASRLESINKYYGTRVIVGEDTYEAVKGRFALRPVDVVAVKGKTRGVRTYELLAGPPDDPDVAPSPDDLRALDLTARAFAAYLARDFRTAAALYGELAAAFPADPLGPLFVRRCEEYLREPPGPDWSGVTQMKVK